jgi:hypothetical protein
VQPAPALRCPQGGVFNIGARATAQDGGHHEGAADLPQIIWHGVSLPLDQQACDRLFCAQDFGIRKGEAI